MSKSKTTSRPYEQTAQQRAELDALRRMLKLSEGTFSLSVAICNSPALRDYVIKYMTGEVQGIEVVRIPEDAQDILDTVRRQIRNGQARAVFVVDMEKALAAEDKRNRVLQNLNVSREQWQATYRCPVVFWLPEYVMSLLMAQARDLWSWVSHQFEFVSEQATAFAGQQDKYAGNVTLAGNLDVHEKRFRIAELEQRIADAGQEPDEQLREHVLAWRNELACLHEALGNLDRAMALHKENEQMGRRWGNLNDLSISLGNQALIMLDRGDMEGAMALHREAERICRQLGNLGGLQRVLGNQALILMNRGDLAAAMDLLTEQERICQQTGNANSLSINLGNRAGILLTLADLDGAMALLKEQERICRQLGNLVGLQASLGNQALVLKARGDLDRATTLLKEVEQISRRLGNVESLALSLANQASVLQQAGRVREALAFAEEAYQLASKHGYVLLARQIEPILNAAREATQGK
ncbi:MAG: tetratricopeptide repeat protein [Phycisphaerae bacterium]|nr:tetratricopeptide repeat protein [Phycisphaerae bacterium]